MRLCPLCSSDNREKLYEYTLSNGSQQTVYACCCGMVYATNPQSTNYSANSLYMAPNAIGSGGTEADRMRLDGIVDTLVGAGISKSARIIDIGCAQGGLLDALKLRGYTNIVGMDPDIACVKAANARGHDAFVGTLGYQGGKYDLIILSHVLEHIEDVCSAFTGILKLLEPGGRVYIEVPDADRYYQFSLPFLDFNSEHINHFGMASLEKALNRNGLIATKLQAKNIQLTNGSAYPAIWTLAERRMSTQLMYGFIRQSITQLAQSEARILSELKGFPNVIVWGAGEYLCHIMPMLRTKRVVQIIDRNPALQGREMYGLKVESPDAARTDCPIIIAAIVAAKSIKADIEARQLKNIVVEVL